MRKNRRRRVISLLASLLLIWLVTAYGVTPVLWKGYARRHPSLEDIPDVTHTGNGIPGDPLNVALIGTRIEVLKLLAAAGWYPADGITCAVAWKSPRRRSSPAL